MSVYDKALHNKYSVDNKHSRQILLQKVVLMKMLPSLKHELLALNSMQLHEQITKGERHREEACMELLFYQIDILFSFPGFCERNSHCQSTCFQKHPFGYHIPFHHTLGTSCCSTQLFLEQFYSVCRHIQGKCLVFL